MKRNRKRTLSLAACLALLFLLAAALSRFPVNEGVMTAEGAARWEEQLYEAERLSYQAGPPEEALWPALSLFTAESEEEALAGYVRLFTEEGEILSSYASVGEGADGAIALSLLAISRKGRTHKSAANPGNLGRGSEWLLSPWGAQEAAQEADGALPHLPVRLLENGTDRGWYDFRLRMPAE